MTRKALTLPGWFIVVSAIVCLGAAVLLAVPLLGEGGSAPAAQATAQPTTQPTATTPAPSPTPSPSEPIATAPTAKTTPAQRDLPVAVFNNTTTTGLAHTIAAKATAAGWTVTATGNWRGLIPSWTVYYPSGHEAAAQTLAADLGISRVRAAVSPMSASRLTVILAGQQ